MRQLVYFSVMTLGLLGIIPSATANPGGSLLVSAGGGVTQSIYDLESIDLMGEARLMGLIGRNNHKRVGWSLDAVFSALDQIGPRSGIGYLMGGHLALHTEKGRYRVGLERDVGGQAHDVRLFYASGGAHIPLELDLPLAFAFDAWVRIGRAAPSSAGLIGGVNLSVEWAFLQSDP